VADLTKPCVKCGAVDRHSNGKCKPCQRKSSAKYHHSDKGRARIRAYLQSDEVRKKRREHRQSDEGRAKEREYRQSDEVREKRRERQRKQRQTAIGRQSQYAAKAKCKKTRFEFSLQNQQKVIEQCQQKLTQPNEIS